ncbi:MAG: redoxin domain-containing protein [Planctomycetales bacterium]|nr:redoxin domain-containing protein [Planctomycetales bacterium]
MKPVRPAKLPSTQRSRRGLSLQRLEPRYCFDAEWQNPVNQFDVNVDGEVAPVDALIVINDLIHNGNHVLPAKEVDYSGPLRDVNGDGESTVIDALLVINSLMRTDVGDVAPQVLLPNQDGELVDIRSFVGESAVVLYFYPKDNTPGCTVEALDFSARTAEIESLGAKIFGVSLDGVESHSEFADTHTLNFEILSDADRKATLEYGALTETADGDPIAKRMTFIIGKDGIIKKMFTDVQVSTHGGDVVAALRDGIAN